MFMLRAFRFITGYVAFCARGDFPERFLNLCAISGISVWNTRIQKGVLYGNMRVSDYFRLPSIARRCRVRVRVRRRRGLNFIVHKYRKRYGIAVGTAVFFAINLLLSSMLWNVNVVGAAALSEQQILSSLERVGVYEGVFRSAVDVEGARLQLLIENQGLSWAAINIDGCIATVDVRETVSRAAPQKTLQPSNIVAAFGGRIISVRAYFGTVAVKTGAAVAKGDLLVSGAVQLKTGATKLVCARAQVMAQTERKIECFIPFEQVRKQPSDRAEIRRVIGLFGAKLPLFFGQVNGPYRVERERYVPQIEGVRLPFAMYTAKFYRINEQRFRINEKTAEKKAADTLAAMAEKQLGKRMVKQLSVVCTKQKNGVSAVAVYSCVEDIAKAEQIIM